MSTTNNSSARWLLQRRRHQDLLEHLCDVRGISSDELELDFDRHLHDPYLLPDMDVASKIIVEAVKNKTKIAVFGDYDADGTPAAALLSMALTRLGLDVTVRLPSRDTGYGLRQIDVEEFAKQAGVLITVDTGITSVTEIELAKKLGMKIIILDHHLPKENLPPADAIVDPFITSSQYPFPHLCGCALAYKFIDALSKNFPNILTVPYKKWLLDLVAISTVADMMPLKGENRALVYFGLKVLKKNRRIGLNELFTSSAIDPNQLTAASLGYSIGPRLNAGGRMHNNWEAFELLTTTEPELAKKLANQIEKTNNDRQKAVEETFKEVSAQLFKQNNPEDFFYVISGKNWSTGVLGLVAGKIANSYNRPTVVLSQKDNSFSGSGRSTNNFSLIDSLSDSKNLLERFGGHKQAAGLVVAEKDLDKFREKVKKYAKSKLTLKDIQPIFSLDAELTPEDLSKQTVKRINQLEPFGYDNPAPLFLLKNISLLEPKRIGRDNSHLRGKINFGNTSISTVGFSLAETFFISCDGQPLDVIGNLEINSWNGYNTMQFKLADISPAGKEVEIIS